MARAEIKKAWRVQDFINILSCGPSKNEPFSLRLNLRANRMRASLKMEGI